MNEQITLDTAPEVSFAELGVPARLVNALTKLGKSNAFPIQIATLPSTLEGRDVLGRGKTGSGKTLAFSIPLVARLSGELAGGARRPGRPLGLVLAPIRELATQIARVVEPLASGSGLSIMTIFGGVSPRPQEDAMRRGVDIVIACPGRLEDLMKQGIVKLDAVEIAVLDGADHMADLGFLPGVARCIETIGASQDLTRRSRPPRGIPSRRRASHRVRQHARAAPCRSSPRAHDLRPHQHPEAPQ
ncbi:DEAD/DEAH box helicase [Pseudoclavibacter alba]|nr:DEAD/DEAH box helicase [Pseudoclavibacter alba]